MDYPEKVNKIYRDAKGDSLAMNALEIMEVASKVPYPEHGDRWGQWGFDSKRLCLVFKDGLYEVNLEDMNTSAQMLDWIFQVSNKTWADRKDIGDLVQALEDLLHPQGNLCSGGIGGKPGTQFNATVFLKERLKVGIAI